MSSRKKDLICVIAAAGILCGGIGMVDGILKPGDAVKSAIKIAAVARIPYLLSRMRRDLIFRSLLRFRRRNFTAALALGLGLYVLILCGYFVLSRFVDFSGIAGKLAENAGVTRGNFLWVSLYISFINSLLEELFFRGFLFTNLKKLANRGTAYGFSALTFSLYHAAMMTGWFSVGLYLLALAGLAVGGMLFNWLNERHGTIYVSWLVHMFANFAINTVGFLLLNG